MRLLVYEIEHVTAYAYLGGVSVSHHLLRLKPRPTTRQRCLAHHLTIAPLPAVTSEHSDYFGNTAHFITVERPHQQLVITARSRVGVGAAFVPELAETPTWEAVRAQCHSDHTGQSLEAHEYTYPSPLVPIDPTYADYAAPSFPRHQPVLAAVMDLTGRIHADFKFDPTATSVTTPVAEVFQQRRGVCQDFAQLEIACLRSLGIPARYVSGYLETDPPPGQAKLRGVDASHAWVSFFCPGIGWIDVDPTNKCLASLRHVTIGWGRDYADICPVRGVLIGGQNQTLRVSVDVVARGAVEADLAGSTPFSQSQSQFQSQFQSQSPH